MLISSVVYGLLAAFLWGVGDLLAKKYVAAWGGSRRWVLIGQVIGVGLYVFFFIGQAILSQAAPNPVAMLVALPPFQIAALALLGLIGFLGYLAFFRAIEIGLLSIVCPIGASWVGIAFVLSACLSPQKIAPLAWVALGIVFIGVLLMSIVRDHRSGSLNESRARGIGAAMGAALCWGIFNYFVKDAATLVGSYVPVFLVKLWGASIVCVWLVRSQIRQVARAPLVDCSSVHPRPHSRFARVALPLAALLDILAYAAFVHGTTLGHVPIVAAFASLFSLVAVVFGVVFLKERLLRVQIAGFIAVAVGSFVLFWVVG